MTFGRARLQRLRLCALGAVAGALLAAPSAPAASANVLANPSFETGTLSGWTPLVPAGGAIDIRPGGMSPETGSYYARLTTGEPGSSTTLSQTVSVSAGDVAAGSMGFLDAAGICTSGESAHVRIRSDSFVIATYSASSCKTLWRPWTHTFAASGSFVVEYRITNVGNSTGDTFLFVDGPSPPPPPPSRVTVDAGGPYSVGEGSSVTLQATSPNSGMTFQWDTNPIEPGYEQSGPSVSYTGRDGPSTATVTVRACNASMECATDTATVDVANVAPTGFFSFPGQTDESGNDVPVGFWGGGTDPSKVDRASLRYAISCYGASLAGTTYATASASSVIGCVYGNGPAVYTVRGRVFDKDGAFTEYTGTVSVHNVAPVIRDLEGLGPTLLGEVTRGWLSYDDPGVGERFTVTVDWGDGFVAESGSASNLSHVYESSGAYSVTVTVSDGAASVSISRETIVYAFPAGGAFVVGVDHAQTGATVTFWSTRWVAANGPWSEVVPGAFEGWQLTVPVGSCGAGSWQHLIGRSGSRPPAVLPEYMGVLVSSSIVKDAPMLVGNIVRFAIVRPDPGYTPALGGGGTGTVLGLSGGCGG